MRGVPTEMKSKKELSTFLARFLLPVIQHSAANYPIYPYVMYYPMQAGLLFEPQGEENMLNMMPNATTVIVSKLLLPSFDHTFTVYPKAAKRFPPCAPLLSLNGSTVIIAVAELLDYN